MRSTFDVIIFTMLLTSNYDCRVTELILDCWQVAPQCLLKQNLHNRKIVPSISDFSAQVEDTEDKLEKTDMMELQILR